MDDTIEQALVHLSAQRSAGPSAAEDAGITAEEIRSEASIELPTWQRHPECHGPPEPLGTSPSAQQHRGPQGQQLTDDGAGKSTVRFMWAPATTALHATGIQTEGMLGLEEDGTIMGACWKPV